MILGVLNNPNAGVNIFGIPISFALIFYTFVILAGFSLVIYLLNLFLRKNEFKKATKINDEEFIKMTTLEASKANIDTEIASIIKDRKELTKIEQKGE
ncbi:TIGR04561 family membrane protein [Mesoplasma seiffertii]|uniref:TIGR04561 family membrane protein n=1 Tax=Mesoplasma seiffertii TaxID=28224 RepID=UPI00047CB383|nr:TIGR04561 family membrane protein [Mesoplasma seiffertii]